MIRKSFKLPPRMALTQVNTMAMASLQQKTASFSSWLDSIFERTSAFEIVTLMTLLLLFLYAGNDWFIEGPVTLLAMAGILYRPWLRNHNYWFIIAAFLVAGNFYLRFTIDNHKYLMTYWVIAITVVLLTNRPQQYLARTARLLIGLAFCFATLWKLITPDYMNGAFFTYEFLTDDRFQNAAEFFGDITPDINLYNDQAMHRLTKFDNQETQVQLLGNDQVLAVAQIMTWWTIIIEGVLALLFLIPTKKWSYRMGSLILLLFLLTTYTNAPVIGFGWLLAVMGLAQCEEEDHGLRFAFILAFLMIWIYSMPWSDLSYGIFNLRLPLAR